MNDGLKVAEPEAIDESVFYYRVPGRSTSQRPGAHKALTGGAGTEFHSHVRLFDHPDPRRLDLHASLRSGRDEWLVRSHRQRAAMPVYAVVDVSASMHVGAPRRKLDTVAAFLESLGNSAFKAGDPAGMCAFDGDSREDLFVSVRHSRGVGGEMAAVVTRAPLGRAAGSGLLPALQRLAGRQALVFLVSDFHWPLGSLSDALDVLERAWVVPIIVWDPSEAEPPAADGFVRVRDAETGDARPLWVNASMRRRWRDEIDARRGQIDAIFDARRIQPLYFTGGFDADALSRYFLELY